MEVAPASAHCGEFPLQKLAGERCPKGFVYRNLVDESFVSLVIIVSNLFSILQSECSQNDCDNPITLEFSTLLPCTEENPFW